MRGLALEGGGARGAYHIGVVKALTENGHSFDGFTGTSIGAINAAVLAQGDFDKALDLWASITMEQIFDIDDQTLLKIAQFKEMQGEKQIPQKILNSVSKVISNKGINTEKIRAFLETYIQEDKVRSSGKDYGLVTVSLSERKPYELMLDEIPQGCLISYIMASSSLPGLRSEIIDGKTFVDGGLYDNCPMNMLLGKGYEQVIAVRTLAPGLVRKPEDTKKVKFISPSDDLGDILWFTPENSKRNISLGYNDGLRFINKQQKELSNL